MNGSCNFLLVWVFSEDQTLTSDSMKCFRRCQALQLSSCDSLKKDEKF